MAARARSDPRLVGCALAMLSVGREVCEGLTTRAAQPCGGQRLAKAEPTRQAALVALVVVAQRAEGLRGKGIGKTHGHEEQVEIGGLSRTAWAWSCPHSTKDPSQIETKRAEGTPAASSDCRARPASQCPATKSCYGAS